MRCLHTIEFYSASCSTLAWRACVAGSPLHLVVPLLLGDSRCCHTQAAWCTAYIRCRPTASWQHSCTFMTLSVQSALATCGVATTRQDPRRSACQHGLPCRHQQAHILPSSAAQRSAAAGGRRHAAAVQCHAAAPDTAQAVELDAHAQVAWQQWVPVHVQHCRWHSGHLYCHQTPVLRQHTFTNPVHCLLCSLTGGHAQAALARLAVRRGRMQAAIPAGPRDDPPSYAAIDAQPHNRLFMHMFRRSVVEGLGEDAPEPGWVWTGKIHTPCPGSNELLHCVRCEECLSLGRMLVEDCNRVVRTCRFDGIITLTRRLSSKFADPRDAHELVISVLRSLFPLWLMPAFRVRAVLPVQPGHIVAHDVGVGTSGTLR